MTKINLIKCPSCELKGYRQTIGELMPSGYVVVQRRHNKPDVTFDHTIIGGKDFYLICGACGDVAFKRETSNIRLTGTVTHFQFGTP